MFFEISHPFINADRVTVIIHARMIRHCVTSMFAILLRKVV